MRGVHVIVVVIEGVDFGEYVEEVLFVLVIDWML